MNILFPKFQAKRLPAMIRLAMTGALIAGLYGAVHDQISYTISPEYFTKLKFRQFAYAHFGWPPRVFAAEVGFLATWWVGLIAGWFVARAGLVNLPTSAQRHSVVKAFLIVLSVTPVTGLIGALIGTAVASWTDLSGWSEFQHALDLEDLGAFVIVAYLHVGSYSGGVIGLVLAVVYVRKKLTQAKLREGSIQEKKA
jgi:hypothetical protein